MPVDLDGRPIPTRCSCILSLEIADGMCVGTSVTSVTWYSNPQVLSINGTLALDNKHQEVDVASKKRRRQCRQKGAVDRPGS